MHRIQPAVPNSVSTASSAPAAATRAPRAAQPAVSTASFALMAPLIFLVLFGTMEGARVFSAWLVITNEAVEAARYGAVRYDSTRDQAAQAGSVSRYLEGRLRGVLAPAGLQPAPLVRITSGRDVDVTIYYRVPLVIPVVSQVLPNPFPLRARAVMRGEPGGL